MRTRQIPPGIAQTLMDAGHDQARSGSEASKVALTGGEPFAVRIRLIDPGDTDPRGHQNLVIARFEAQSTKLQEPTLSIPDVCSRIGVAERTLRLCFRQHFGMGPKQFLLQRRMLLAREALMAADPGSTTVTEVATRFGFWELGRFAVRFRALFGESPSAVLRQCRSSDTGRLRCPPVNTRNMSVDNRVVFPGYWDNSRAQRSVTSTSTCRRDLTG
jgi:AraC-like DNA-binding protein